MSDELRAGLYAFDLVQKRAKRPAGAPDKALARPVTKVGIVGAGLMASQLALLFARRLEVPVVLTDLDQERVDKGVGYVHAEIDKLLAKGRINHGQGQPAQGPGHRLDRPRTRFADADFVIEAVFEEMAVKKQVFAEVEAVVSPECVLATNTSSLSITEMAADLEHPERVVGFHFFNPVAVLPLLEIVRGERTDDATLATAFAVGKALKKTLRPGQGRARRSSSTGCSTRFMGEVVADRRRGHPGRGRRHARSPAGPADAAVRAAAAGRPGDRAARRRDAARGVPGPVLRLARTSAGWSRPGKPGVYVWDAGEPELDPEVAGAARAAATRRSTEEQVRDAGAGRAGRGGPADARRGRRRRGRRTSTWHDHSAPAGRSTWAASRRTWTGPASPSGSPAGGSCRRAWPACPPDRSQRHRRGGRSRPCWTDRPPRSRL